MKKAFLIGFIIALFIVVPNVNAATKKEFEIKANSSWGYDVQLRSSIKDGSNKYTAVQWLNSDHSSHKMWFRVIDTSGNEKGRAILTYLNTDAFETNLSNGGVYYLQAKREFFIDPITKVSGYWLA